MLEKNIVSDTNALLELSTLLNASLDLDFILGNVLLSSMGKLLVPRGFICVQTSDWHFEVLIAKGLPSEVLHKEFVLTRQWNASQILDEIPMKELEDCKDFFLFCESHRIPLLIPMILNHRMVGFMCLGNKMIEKEFCEEELTFLESIANIAASAVQNAITVEQLRQSNRKLDSKIQELNTLFEFGREVNTTFDEKKILRLLSYALMGQLKVRHYAVFVRRDDRMECALHKTSSLEISEEILIAFCELSSPIIRSNDFHPSTELEDWVHRHAFMAVFPMRSQNETRGVLCLGERLGGEWFDAVELEFLSALANVTVSALENARLVQEMVEKHRLERELNIARDIQLGLLPKKLPAAHGYDLAAVNISSQQIGGDYYDVIPLSDHEFVIAIADVSGKGIPASLLMANVQAALRVLAPLRLTMAETTARINAIIHQNTSPDKFITFFWGLLNTATHSFRYVNAGHNPPYLLRRDGTSEELDEGGIILGILAKVPPYQEAEIFLKPHECIVLFTDGVSEAMNEEEKEFTEERLLDILALHKNESASQIIDATHRAVLDYTGAAPQSDDITMVVVKRISD